MSILEWEDFVTSQIGNKQIMKIKKWEDLDGKFIDNKRIFIWAKEIRIWVDDKSKLILSRDLDDDQIIAHLALFNINIEFIKEPTITKEEHDFLQWLYTRDSNANIYRTLKDCNWRSKDVGWTKTASYFSELEYGIHYLVSDLLKLKVEG